MALRTEVAELEAQVAALSARVTKQPRTDEAGTGEHPDGGQRRAFAPHITTPKTHDLPARIHLTHEGWVTQRNCLIPGGHSSLYRLIVYDVGNVTSKLRRYVGWRNFGLRRTRLLHLESTFAHVVLDGVQTRTVVLTLTPTQRARLQGARTLGPAPLIDQRPTRAQRTVSCRGGTQIIG